MNAQKRDEKSDAGLIGRISSTQRAVTQLGDSGRKLSSVRDDADTPHTRPIVKIPRSEPPKFRPIRTAQEPLTSIDRPVTIVRPTRSEAQQACKGATGPRTNDKKRRISASTVDYFHSERAASGDKCTDPRPHRVKLPHVHRSIQGWPAGGLFIPGFSKLQNLNLGAFIHSDQGQRIVSPCQPSALRYLRSPRRAPIDAGALRGRQVRQRQPKRKRGD